MQKFPSKTGKLDIKFYPFYSCSLMTSFPPLPLLFFNNFFPFVLVCLHLGCVGVPRQAFSLLELEV